MKSKILFLLLIIFSTCILFGCNTSEKTVEDIASEITEVRIRFLVDDNLYETIEYKLGDELQMPKEPTKEGYRFVGWFTRDDKEFDVDNITKNITLYAKFESLNGETEKTPDNDKTPVLPDKGCTHENLKEKKVKVSNSCISSIIYYECKDCKSKILDLDKFDFDCSVETTKENVYYDKDGNRVMSFEGVCSDCGLRISALNKVEAYSSCISLNTYKYSFYNKNYDSIIEDLYYYDEIEHHNFASYNSEFIKLGDCEKDGYEIIENCDKCGETRKNILYGHKYEYEEEIINTKCGDFIIYGEKCIVCGVWSAINTNRSCNLENEYHFDYEDGLGYELKERCTECGLTMTISSNYTFVNNCEYKNTYKLSVEYNGTLYEKVSNRFEARHQYEYSTYDFNGDCDSGYTLKETCKNCDYQTESTQYGHWNNEDKDIYEDFCNGTVEIARFGCIACGSDEYISVNDYASWSLISNDNNCEYYVCANGCCEKQISWWNEKGNDCETKQYIRYVYTHNNNVVIDVTENRIYNNHRFEYSVIKYGDTCQEGYEWMKYCANCDYKEGWYSGYGHFYVYEEFVYSELCILVRSITEGCIVCGENYSQYIYEDDYNWNYITGDENSSYYVCSNGCCEKYVENEETKDENCNIESIKTVRLYNDGNLIVEYSDSEYTVGHEYEITYELYDRSCAYGYLEHNTCKYCGSRTTEEKFVHQNTFEIITLNNPGYCGSEIVNDYCWVCNETLTFGVNYDNCSWEYLSETDGICCYKCEYCNALKYEGQQIFGANEYCISETHYYYQIVHNNNTLVDLDAVSYQTAHDIEFTIKNYLGSCENGYDLVGSCKNCEYEYNSYYNGHSYYDKSVDVNVNGYCGAKIMYLSSCMACDVYKEAYFEYENCVYNSEFDAVNNTWIYTCEVCGAVKTVGTQFVSKNEYCISLYKTIVSIGYGGEIIAAYSYIFESQIEHDYDVEATYYGYDCYEGVDCIYTCKVCGDSYSETRYSHDFKYTREQFEEDGICGLTIVTAQCIICDRIVEITFENEKCEYYLFHQQTYDDYVEEVHRCDKCGSHKYYHSYDKVEVNSCTSTQNIEFLLLINNYDKYQGNFAFTETMTVVWLNHNYFEEYQFYGNDCEDGVYVTVKCSECEISNSYETDYHQIDEKHEVISGINCFAQKINSTCVRCEYKEDEVVYLSCDTFQVSEDFYEEDGTLKCHVIEECTYCGSIHEFNGIVSEDEYGKTAIGTTKIYVNDTLVVEYNDYHNFTS